MTIMIDSSLSELLVTCVLMGVAHLLTIFAFASYSFKVPADITEYINFAYMYVQFFVSITQIDNLLACGMRFQSIFSQNVPILVSIF